jgi:succinate dehydrogenase hydrophobic anchor subunit
MIGEFWFYYVTAVIISALIVPAIGFLLAKLESG